MYKTLIYVVILSVLGMGIWLFFFRDTNDLNATRTAGGVMEDAFQTKDTGNIGKIFLAGRDGVKNVLERNEKGWTLDGSHVAAPFMVEQLLTTMAQQKAMEPVIDRLRDDVVRDLAGNGIKTELYDLQGKLIKTFYVGGDAGGYNGTYMLMEGGKKPYIVQVPLFTGYVTPRYMPNAKTWRDRQVLMAKPEDITTISVEYPLKPLNSFTLIKGTEGNVEVQSAVIGGIINQENAKTYFGFFEKLYTAAWVNGDPGIDSILGSVPLICNLTLSQNEGTPQKATFFFMPLNKRSKNFSADGNDPRNDYDADNGYAVFNDNKDTAVIQFQMFDKLFRKASEFYQNEEK